MDQEKRKHGNGVEKSVEMVKGDKEMEKVQYEIKRSKEGGIESEEKELEKGDENKNVKEGNRGKEV
jgi:hypothetical protein